MKVEHFIISILVIIVTDLRTADFIKKNGYGKYQYYLKIYNFFFLQLDKFICIIPKKSLSLRKRRPFSFKKIFMRTPSNYKYPN